MTGSCLLPRYNVSGHLGHVGPIETKGFIVY